MDCTLAVHFSVDSDLIKEVDKLCEFTGAFCIGEVVAVKREDWITHILTNFSNENI